MTQTFVVRIDLHHGISRPSETLAAALARAIEYALDNDLAGAEALNRQDCGQVSVCARKAAKAPRGAK